MPFLRACCRCCCCVPSEFTANIDSIAGSLNAGTVTFYAGPGLSNQIGDPVNVAARLEGKTARQKNPHPKGSLAFAAWVIARLGGWNGYHGKPGPKTMRWGLDDFQRIKFGTTLRLQDV